MKRLLPLLIVLVLSIALLPCFAAAAEGLENFTPRAAYDGRFTDVPENAWYRDSVEQAFSLGLMQGVSPTAFRPAGTLSFAESVSLAARLHSIYSGGQGSFPASDPWYRSAADYALDQEILSREPEDYTASITRGEFALLLAAALPDEALEEINTITEGAIPDVAPSDRFHDAMVQLYRAGVLTGTDEIGSARSGKTLTRCEAAAILLRMADPSKRQSLTLTETTMTVYAPDGRTKEISVSELAVNERWGWYRMPVTQMYAPEDRSKVVPTAQVESWQDQGWYLYPVTRMYATENRSKVVPTDKVEENLPWGWYLYPVTRMYATENREKVVPTDKVEENLPWGWYLFPVTRIYFWNGQEQVVPTSELESWQDKGWATEVFTPLPQSIKNQGKTVTGIPVISVSTGGREILSKENYVNCTVNTYNCPKGQTLSGESGGIRLRGNASSFYGNVSQIRANPVPYRLKFDSKVNMLGLNDGAKCKSWVLLTNLEAEKDVVKNDIAFRMGRMLMEPDGLYCSDAQLVHLYINGSFKGTYLLCEQNQANKKRVNVAEPEDGYTGTDVGYFVEMDGYFEAPNFMMNYEGASVTDVRGHTRTFRPNSYTVKTDTFSQQQVDFIAKYMRGVFKIVYQACERGNYLTFDGNYNLVQAPTHNAKDTIALVADLDSMVDMYILYELMCDFDCGESSFYFAVDFSAKSKYPKLTFCAPWDFNWTCLGNASGPIFAGAFRDESFISSLGDRSNPWFILLYKQGWFRQMLSAKWNAIGRSSGVEACILRENTLLDRYYSDINRRGNGAVGSSRVNLNWIKTRAKWLDSIWQ